MIREEQLEQWPPRKRGYAPPTDALAVLSDMPQQPSEDRIEGVNDELAQQGITARQRQWETLDRGIRETRRSISLNATEANAIFE